MKSNSIQKLSFYLTMLKSRYGEGEYFIGMEISYKSGTKTFPATVKSDDGKLVMKFINMVKIFYELNLVLTKDSNRY